MIVERAVMWVKKRTYFGKSGHLRALYTVSGTRDNPSSKATYRAFICENVGLVGWVKVDLA